MPMNNRLLRPTTGLDPDAAKYLAAVEAADGEPLEPAVRAAINAFFRDSKAAGVFDALKACCILAGARTLAGALVPVVGDAPTNVANGFVSGDYTRGGATPGLKGDGTSYLDSGRATNADPTSSMHLAVYPTAIGTTNLRAAGSYAPAESDEVLIMNGDVRCRSRDTLSNVTVLADAIYGVSRSSSTEWYARGGQSDFAGSTGVAASANSRNMFIFAYNNDGSPFGISDATLAFYSIGESLSLEDLDTAVTNLITAIGEAL